MFQRSCSYRSPDALLREILAERPPLHEVARGGAHHRAGHAVKELPSRTNRFPKCILQRLPSLPDDGHENGDTLEAGTVGLEGGPGARLDGHATRTTTRRYG